MEYLLWGIQNCVACKNKGLFGDGSLPSAYPYCDCSIGKKKRRKDRQRAFKAKKILKEQLRTE